MSKIFGEEHFIDEDMISLVRSEIDNKIDKMVFDKMQQAIYLRLPEIKINEDKLRNWVLLCMKLENIEHSDLIDIATKKKFADLEQQLAEKDKVIEYLQERNFYKVELKNEECLGIYPKNMEKIIRHQICEEISKALDEYIDTHRWKWETPNGKPKIVYIPNFVIRDILRKVEKGESE